MDLKKICFRLARNVNKVPPIRRLRSEVLTRLANNRWRGDDATILTILHPHNSALNKGMLRWLEQNFPQCRRYFDLRLMPPLGVPTGIGNAGFDIGRYTLALMWLQDPISSWSGRVQRQSVSIEQRMRKAGLALMNSPTQMIAAEKAATARLAHGLHVRTPRTLELQSPDELRAFQRLLNGPVLIRSDWAHGGPIYRIEAHETFSWNLIQKLQRPIATEFIDTSDANGVFWKFRYLAAGNHGANVHQIASTHWEVRGRCKLTNHEHLDRERVFITAPNPHHAILQQVQLALNLDTVALDYAFDSAGTLVLWEANPCPGLWFGPKTFELRYREEAIHRSYAALTGAYLDRAGLPIPQAIEELRTYAPASQHILKSLLRN